MKMMMQQQSSRFTVPRWLKWVLSLVAILLLIGSLFALWMYMDINHDRTAGFEEAKQLAIEETELSQAKQVSLYHGSKTVHIVKGENEGNEEIIVYVDLLNSEILSEKVSTNIMAIDELENKWRQDCSSCVFKNIQFAFEENQPVYQITYIDEKDRYVFNYFLLSGDKFNQKFAFKQN